MSLQTRGCTQTAKVPGLDPIIQPLTQKFGTRYIHIYDGIILIIIFTIMKLLDALLFRGTIQGEDIIIAVGYLTNAGIMQKEKKLLLKHYCKSLNIRLDILSILPTDLLYLSFPEYYPLMRLNRLFRWKSVRQFFNRTIHITKWVLYCMFQSISSAYL